MSKKNLYLLLITFACAIAFAAACSNSNIETATGFKPEIVPLPAQLSTYEPMTIPADNPLTETALREEIKQWQGSGGELEIRVSGARDGVSVLQSAA